MSKLVKPSKENMVLTINIMNKLRSMVDGNRIVVDCKDIKGLSKPVSTLLDDINSSSLGFVKLEDFVDFTDTYGGVLPSNKIVGLVTSKMSTLDVMKYYLEFRHIQDIDILKEKLFEHSLRNGDMRVTMIHKYEFEYKKRLHSYTLETTYIRTLGDLFKVERVIKDLLDLEAMKYITSTTEITKVTSSQRIKKTSGCTSKELLNDIALGIVTSVDNIVTVKNGLRTTIVEDQYLNNHPSGKVIVVIDKVNGK